MKNKFLIVLSFLILFAFHIDLKAQENVKPKNVVILIGDGMGLTQISAAMIANGGDLNILKMPATGFIKTSSADNLITDSGASGTAMATGHKTKNGAIGVDSSGKTVRSILEIAQELNKSTGLIVTSSITHATPAAFYAHQVSRKMDEEIALDLFNSNIDVIIGGGRKHFKNRSDKRDLIEGFQLKDYKYIEDYKKLDRRTGKKILALLANDYLDKYDKREDFYEVAFYAAFRKLIKDDDGFFLMIEGSQIDWAGHANNDKYLIGEMLEFDKLVGMVLKYLGQDNETLIIVLADHETGGVAITGGSMDDKTVDLKFASKKHTPVLIPVFAQGPGAENFVGVYENTQIFYKILELIQ